MKHIKILSYSLLLLGLFAVVCPVTAQATETVFAVLFYSPTCPHCHEVINESLPPIRQTYGEQLIVFYVDISTQSGNQMAQSAYEHYQIPRENWVVPMMIIDNQVLIGAYDIPTRLPSIVDAGLLEGGIAVPDFPAMQASYNLWLEDNPTYQTTAKSVITQRSFLERLQADPLAYIITIGVLIGLVVSALALIVTRKSGIPLLVPQVVIILTSIIALVVALTVLLSNRSDGIALPIAGVTFIGILFSGAVAVYGNKIRPAIVLLTIVGLAISVYMAYIEITATSAVCGVIGDCNAVQQSDYAFIMGIPVGLIGIIGYLGMLILAILINHKKPSYLKLAERLLTTAIAIAVLFSIYLTTLELAIIGAICAWCLMSALVVLNLMWLVIPTIRDIETSSKPTPLYLVPSS